MRELTYHDHMGRLQHATDIVSVGPYGVIISITKLGGAILVPWSKVQHLAFNYMKDDEMVRWLVP